MTKDIECRYCEKTLEDDDLVYRVLYGRLHYAREGVVSGKLAGTVDEELEPGTDERYWCFGCYKEHRDRERGAHYHYTDADELWAILEAANGRLVADAKAMSVGGRGWFRVVDGDVEARHSVMIRGGEDDDWDVGFETEPTPDFGPDDFGEFFGDEPLDDPDDAIRRLVFLKPVSETPFVAGMNRTLGALYD